MGKVASSNGPGKLKHFQGKIVHRRNLHGNQEKSKKKEETLTAERGPGKPEKFHWPLREAPLEGPFLFPPASTNFAITALWDVSQ
jgi:hypothetical protein